MSKSEIEQIAREERNAYFREYRKKNKQRVAEYQKRYWERKAEAKLKADD